MQRKLASIQTVKSVEAIIHPIDGTVANIEVIRFENIAWQCVVKKGEFRVGDKAIYIEISSIVPDSPEFEFLRSRKFKVNTIRLLGVLSQGLALPLDVIFKINPMILEIPDEDVEAVLVDGADVTELIGVTRYEPPQEIRLNGSGPVYPFPTDIVPKTDEERIQSIPHILKEMEGESVVATLKYDGTSATYFYDNDLGRIRACSRNMEKSPDESVYWKVITPEMERFLKLNPYFVLQGEIVGPGIQKNRLGLSSVKFFAFNLFNRNTGDYEPFHAARIVAGLYGIPWVDFAHVWDIFEGETVESLLELAKGFYPGTSNPREGLVLRLLEKEKFSYTLGGRVSCKVINNDYLLGGGE